VQLKTIIFDMDGVIVDTEPVHHYAYYQLFKKLGIQVSDELYTSFTGNSTKNIFEKIKQKFQLQQDIATLVRAKRDLFNNAFDTKEDLFLINGVEDIIKSAYHKKIQLIVASSASKETINRVFKRFGLHQYFTHLVSGEDFEQSKPHPAIFLEAQRLSGHSKKNCIVIEDSTNGIIASNKAGIFCVGYQSKNSKNQDYTLANLVIKDFSEINLDKII
jgi:HAD superfamily hydrolase (TIGR01509 family)